MNRSKYNEAQKAYESGDYRSALKGFLESIDREHSDNGPACHMAGNCMLRLRRHSDAETAYRRALLDETYDKTGAVRANLGVALTSQGDYTNAVKEFELALEDQSYATPHKAYSGMGNALLKCGRTKDAAFAFRAAAGEKGNTDPGKALVNLGICFMALDRPNDAADAYRAALGIEGYAGKGKASANLGQAYVAAGRMREAFRAFEQATERYSQKLSPAAERDFEKARLAVEGPSTGIVPEIDPNQAFAPSVERAVEAVPAKAPVSAAEPAPAAPEPAPIATDPAPAPTPVAATQSFSATGGIPVAVETDFFSATEAELRVKDREERREQRRKSHAWIKVLVAFVIAFVVVGGGAAGAYLLGYGLPSQESVAKDLVMAHAAGEDVDSFWVVSPGVDIIRAMMAVPPSTNLSIDSMERSAVKSVAIVTLTLENDTPVRYKMTFAREGVGWKVSNIETYFVSNDAK